MQVIPVDVKSALFEQFLQVPWQIHLAGLASVAPTKEATRAQLSPDNLFFEHGEAQAYLCVATGHVIGRIVASTDERRRDVPGVGHFGYFEVLDSEEAARALLSAAEEWLRSKGKYIAEGPIDLNIWTRYRVQMSGFDLPPYLGEPRSPPYYARLLAAAGYRPRLIWRSYDFSTRELQTVCKHFAARRDAKRASEPSLPPQTSHPWREKTRKLQDLHAVIMESWTGNYGFSYINEQEYACTFASLAQVMDMTLCCCYRDETSTCAFVLCHLDPLATPKRVVIKAYGIVPSHRKTSLVHEMLRDLTWHGYATGLPAVVSLAVEPKDLWGRFKSPARVHGVFSKVLG